MRQDSGDKKSMGVDVVNYVEPNDGRKHFQPGEPQSAKNCEECIYFDRDLAADNPCGLCYESKDKYEWRTEDARCGEMELPSERVCEAPVREGQC